MKSQLCDGTVLCEDGTQFKIHRCILAAVSPYFKALFTNSINRDQAEATVANLNIPGEIFQVNVKCLLTIFHNNFARANGHQKG